MLFLLRNAGCNKYENLFAGSLHVAITHSPMKIKSIFPLVCACSFAAGGHLLGANLLVNGGFEQSYSGQPSVPGFAQTTNVPGWSTTATDGLIEVWGSGLNTVNAANGTTPQTDGGDYFAEINATQAASLFQDVTINSALSLEFAFLHRGRGDDNRRPIPPSSDQIRLKITDLGTDGFQVTDTVLYSNVFTTDNVNDPGEFNGFAFYSAANIFTSTPGNTYRFEFESVSTGSGDLTIGNFVDAVAFGTNVIPEPSTTLLLGLGSIFFLRRKRS